MKKSVIISVYTYMQNRFKHLTDEGFFQVNNYQPQGEDINKTKHVMISPYTYLEVDHDLSSLTVLG